ncbi:DUF1932 domain-containing protein [Klebsiella aerogenes]|uniref:NAD(P)-dependent oxidoreductase n=1 Tax=Klebsiella aerogenes TaxID=548 RepID=A0AAP9R1J4_KLEAE|nr:NAD(P)-dependent oxidoreductase [Klebsiella aerogenes]
MEIVFIGFGEAAYHLCLGLAGNPAIHPGAFDAALDDPERGRVIRIRAQKAGVQLYTTLPDACATARYIICLTSADSALSVARQVLPLLGRGQHYIDMNSASPAVKQAINALPRHAGVGFCDAAVMGTVPERGHRVPVLLAGTAAQPFADDLAPYGMDLTVLQAEPGAASAIKMLKSVVMKGLPQLFIESFCAAEKFGVLAQLVDSLGQSLNGKTVEQLAETFCARTLLHAGRRSAEMRDVVDTLRTLQVDSGMSEAARKKLAAQSARSSAACLAPEGEQLNWQNTIVRLVRHERGICDEK